MRLWCFYEICRPYAIVGRLAVCFGFANAINRISLRPVISMLVSVCSCFRHQRSLRIFKALAFTTIRVISPSWTGAQITAWFKSISLGCAGRLWVDYVYLKLHIHDTKNFLHAALIHSGNSSQINFHML